MNIRDIASHIYQEYSYYITPQAWGRIGSLTGRYGADTVYKILTEKKIEGSNLYHILSYIEKECQRRVSSEIKIDGLEFNE